MAATLTDAEVKALYDLINHNGSVTIDAGLLKKLLVDVAQVAPPPPETSAWAASTAPVAFNPEVAVGFVTLQAGAVVSMAPSAVPDGRYGLVAVSQ